MFLPALAAATEIVIANHGWNLHAAFFPDMKAMTQPGPISPDFVRFSTRQRTGHHGGIIFRQLALGQSGAARQNTTGAGVAHPPPFVLPSPVPPHAQSRQDHQFLWRLFKTRSSGAPTKRATGL